MCPFNLHSHVQPGNVEMLLSSRQIQHNGKWRCIHNLKDFQFVFLQEEKKQLQRKKKKKSGWFGKCVKFPNFAGEQNWAFLWEPTSWTFTGQDLILLFEKLINFEHGMQL